MDCSSFGGWFSCLMHDCDDLQLRALFSYYCHRQLSLFIVTQTHVFPKWKDLQVQGKF